MTANDRKALALLARMVRARAGNFGQAMSTSDVVRKPQAYARNGGKALNRLVRLGYAEPFVGLLKGDDWGWRITITGRVAAKNLSTQENS